ncbi:cation diffusion facilitator family transporter [uncultured Eubacterium sp.]|uniref:cation diffusion facilitator family transporter n=1 Tax=uncultured Eubacterium sp. TaxID=165185 RepID=UPI0025899F45|nr:cation diffusion facilitator family transporter [uncultured Eubacterium sp.]
MLTRFLINFGEKKKFDREAFAVMSGGVGIICNILLAVFKFAVGKLSGSISITADALNNLSDVASNGVTIVGARLSKKPVDKEHPFGHGRMEYISALAVSALILIMGFELAKSSVQKIINPEELNFSFVYIIILGASILVKLWMAYFNNRLYKHTDNINLKAVRQDSLNDCISTGATILALCITHIFKIAWIDGAIGLCVAVIILLGGIDIAKEIISPLLGQPPKKELVDNIERIMLEPEYILGVHDLIVHDYGPGRIIASAHAEVPSNIDVMKLHDIIDNVESKINKELSIIMCIHMDPIVVDDKEVDRYKALAKEIIEDYDSDFTFHDFRVVKGETHTNLIFDLIIPFCDDSEKAKISADLTKRFKEKDPSLELVMVIEHSFI